MRKVRIITDSNSGILQSQAKELGIFVIPMPFTINGHEFLEEISISQEQFYYYLADNSDVTTSQPSQYYLEELWDEELKTYDEILYIPMTSLPCCFMMRSGQMRHSKGRCSRSSVHPLQVSIGSSSLSEWQYPKHPPASRFAAAQSGFPAFSSARASACI